ncbi:LysR family transcriptional regulator [Paenibacillus chitinolyticus]|uniref:LysR family transcriptional regulator n=1 Tax=Paenibacillus chitinolyticus TaxID=79263 RepID=A0A410WZF8_9BACL|nr:LysR family transcriptional regulator [Paenibacillus chitinolyticus]MCY9590442.1 LysR family transcriptional regulator [Paenibacillus chitinolyticus]MCY9596563.1 LysR family transcriptional regulator [Paenibacillus chitinolyticus]QAV19571.1 LysR family transcriptional regulator [Paenibacillus chitinolyticus]
MDIKKMYYFMTIVEEGQITKAAQRLHMAQPPLSLQLKALEEELGVTLIDRENKRFEITPAGWTFYKRAKEILHSIDGAIAEIKEQQNGLRGTLSIGTVMSCVPYLPSVMKQFRLGSPRVSFQLWEADSFRVEELLQNKVIEMGIVRLPLQSYLADRMPRVSIHRLQTEPLVAVFPPEWKVPDGTSVPVSELASSPLLILRGQGDYGVYHKFIETCKTSGFEPNLVCESPDVSTLMILTDSGLGISVVPRSALLLKKPGQVRYAEIDPPIESDTAIITLEHQFVSQAARNFKELLIGSLQ